MLEINHLDAFYGSSQVLFGIDLSLKKGETITLLGRNGMGKTTTVSCLMGQVKWRGQIQVQGRSLEGLPSYQVARLGLGWVPEGRQIFPTLRVSENLIATASNRHQNPSPWTLQRVYELFPRLEERAQHMGAHLSGGEQQMLAIGRALMTNPLLLILDEATEGLAPLIREEIWHCLELLKQAGQTAIIIDKNLDALLDLADRHYVLEKGHIVWQGDSASLRNERKLIEGYIGV